MRLLAGLMVATVWLLGATPATAQNIGIDNLTQAEGNSGTTSFDITVTLSAASGDTVTVDWNTQDGAALAPDDYAAASGTVTFLPGSTSEIVTVSVVGDTVYEANEHFYVKLSNPVNASITDNSSTVWIQNDDVRVGIANLTQAEGNSGTTDFDFTLTLSASYPLEFRVDWATSDGTAIAGDDYIAASGTAVFPPGSTTQIVTVSVIGDTVYEGDDYFRVQLSNPVNGGIGDDSATAWIDNDDVRVGIANLTQAEGNSGTTEFDITLTLSGTYPLEFRVDWATSDGTAIAGDDYVAASGTAVFPPGSTTQIVTVSVIGDTVYEGDDFFRVQLSNPVNGSIYDDSATVWIDNDDVRVSIANLTQAEGNSGTTDFNITLTLSGTYPLEFSVDWATTDGSAISPDDYVAASGRAIFPPGSTTQIVTVEVVGDTDWETNDYFYVNLSNPVNGSIYDDSATVWIDNDDVRVSIANRTADEGNSGTTDFVFDVTLSAAYDLPTSVDWATADSTAIAPDDYIAASGTVDFLAGEILQTVTVQVAGDLFRELDERFEVRLSNPVNMSIGDGVALGTITNDDTYPAITIHDAAHFEGNGGTADFDLPVTLSAAYVEEVRVYYQTANGTAVEPDDYTRTTASIIVFPAGVTDGIATVPVVGDHEVEPDETFQVTLYSPTNGTIADGNATATILNDDLAGDLFIDDVSLSEGDAGTTDFIFTVSLAESNPATVQVDYATADGTAKADVDYIPASGTVVFDPGEIDKPVTVQVIGDPLDECDDQFSVLLSNPVNGTIGDGEGTGTILSDDLLACANADGDCYHDTACGGRDCDDTVAETYPEAVEVNDALDNQCPGDHGYGVVDEICGACGFLNPADATELSWPAQEYATSYDVARSTVGDFSSDCTLLPVTSNPHVQDPVTPAIGQVYFYLVRPLAPYQGSWGKDSSGAERTFTCP